MQVTALEPTDFAQDCDTPQSNWLTFGSSKLLLMLMVGCGMVIRAVVVAFSFRGISSPQGDFGQFSAEMGWVARSIALGRGFTSPFYHFTGPTALVPPLFPYLLAGVFKNYGLYSPKSAVVILMLDSLFSVLTCIPIYLCLREAAGEKAARLAAWLWVVYPFSIYYASAQVWDYALTSMLFAWCFYFAMRLPQRKSLFAWFGFGALYGVTALSNPSILSLLPFLLLLALYRVKQAGGKVVLRAVATALAFLLMVAPWTVRNYREMHGFVPIRDGFWLEFWAGNHGDMTRTNPGNAHPATNEAEMQKFEQQGETAYLAEKHVLGMAWVSQHPVLFVEVTGRRIFRFWTGFWSFAGEYLREEPLDVPNLFFCSAVTFFMLIGIRRWWRMDRSAALPYALVITIFPITYYLSHTSMDYRQPIEPEIMILVAMGILGLRKAKDANALQDVATMDEERELVAP